MINQVIASFVLIILIKAATITGSEFFDTHDAKIDQILKKVNKPALKSIKSPDGDIIDCVHMKNHPIYDHPLFKNYTIQMRPSSYPDGWSNENLDTKNENIVTQLWTLNGKCPKNSIPIRRTKREDILRVKLIKRFGKKKSSNLFQPNLANLTKNNDIHEYAILNVNGKFYGGRATINVWKPYVQRPNEFSLAQMWVVAGPIHELNSIEFGWQVYPGLYGDDNPRSFTFWTNNGYRTGYYNYDHGGFIPVNQEFALGATIDNVSIFGGQQYHIPTTIWKDPRSGDWWLKLNHDLFIGYWPSILFKHLQNGANAIHWGGEITNSRIGLQHTKTRMGSGHFAEEGFKKVSYFRNIEIYTENGIWKKLEEGDPVITKPSCYNIKSGYDIAWGKYFFYGGPGRNQNCL